jgi:hypothetical protein
MHQFSATDYNSLFIPMSGEPQVSKTIFRPSPGTNQTVEGTPDIEPENNNNQDRMEGVESTSSPSLDPPKEDGVDPMDTSSTGNPSLDENVALIEKMAKDVESLESGETEMDPIRVLDVAIAMQKVIDAISAEIVKNPQISFDSKYLPIMKNLSVVQNFANGRAKDTIDQLNAVGSDLTQSEKAGIPAKVTTGNILRPGDNGISKGDRNICAAFSSSAWSARKSEFRRKELEELFTRGKDIEFAPEKPYRSTQGTSSSFRLASQKTSSPSLARPVKTMDYNSLSRSFTRPSPTQKRSHRDAGFDDEDDHEKETGYRNASLPPSKLARNATASSREPERGAGLAEFQSRFASRYEKVPIADASEWLVANATASSRGGNKAVVENPDDSGLMEQGDMFEGCFTQRHYDMIDRITERVHSTSNYGTLISSLTASEIASQ